MDTIVKQDVHSTAESHQQQPSLAPDIPIESNLQRVDGAEIGNADLPSNVPLPSPSMTFDDAITYQSLHAQTAMLDPTLGQDGVGTDSFVKLDNVTPVAAGESLDLDELYYGTTAITEEDMALQYGLALMASRRLSDRQHRVIEARLEEHSGVHSNVNSDHGSNNMGDNSCCGRDLEDGDDSIEEDEEENDNCLSGVCLPSSQFFQTSVICSNTMARDGLANERTFLSWLSVSMSLCLVSFSFISRFLTLDNLSEETRKDYNPESKDRLSRWIGYVCFGCALVSAIYSMLKYLRNIRRISTRYPFVQAGKWTFTVGMVLGTLIMVALVLSYTEDI
ncbi:hypothetical protein BGZ94_008954 [Podila epigama]|nr:hypothetical protein BGZ94_008954 [Podila epigama]